MCFINIQRKVGELTSSKHLGFEDFFWKKIKVEFGQVSFKFFKWIAFYNGLLHKGDAIVKKDCGGGCQGKRCFYNQTNDWIGIFFGSKCRFVVMFNSPKEKKLYRKKMQTISCVCVWRSNAVFKPMFEWRKQFKMKTENKSQISRNAGFFASLEILNRFIAQIWGIEWGS